MKGQDNLRFNTHQLLLTHTEVNKIFTSTFGLNSHVITVNRQKFNYQPSKLKKINHQPSKLPVQWHRLFHILKTVRLQQLRGVQSFKQGVWKGYHLSIWGIRKGYLFYQKWLIKGVGPRLEPSRIKLCWVTPPPPPPYREFTLHSLMNFHMTPIRLIELLYRK